MGMNKCTMKIQRTAIVKLRHDIRSEDGEREYKAGSYVFMAIEAGATCCVWQKDSPPIGATFEEMVGNDLVEFD